MSSDKPQLNLIIICSKEGRLLHPTLRSIERASKFAERKSIKTVITLLISDASSQTTEFIKESKDKYRLDIHVITSNSKDKDLPETVAIQNSSTDLVGFIRAGDLISETFIDESFNILNESADNTVVHPEYALAFGSKDKLTQYAGSNSAGFSMQKVIEDNPFCYAFIAKRGVFEKIKFQKQAAITSRDVRVWMWVSDSLVRGNNHVVAPGTLYADRWNEDDPRLSDLPGTLLMEKSLLSPEVLENFSAGGQPTEVLYTKKAQNLERARRFVDASFRARLLNPVRKRSFRFNNYLDSMRNETLHLFRPPEVNNAIRIPDWVLEAVKKLHEIELRIFLSSHLKSLIEISSPQAGNYAFSYCSLLNAIQKDCDLLIVMPYIKNGGAEREVLNLIKANLDVNPNKKITVLTTERGGSPWKEVFEEYIQVVEVPDQFYALSLEEQGRLVAKVCIQMQLSQLHVVNSYAGYVAMDKYGELISKNTKIYITIFMIDHTDEGRRTHLFTERMVYAIDNVEIIFTDNQTVVNQLVELMAISPEKFSVHYQPIDFLDKVPISLEERFTKNTARIMWAGRMDRQKRPDILVEIANRVRERSLPAEFTAYGGSAFNDNYYTTLLSEGGSVIDYRGPYEGGLFSLPVGEFDIFLMTSEWEGMPNVLLEAIVSGMLVIAPNVGGVGELIKDGETGFLISSFDAVDEYADAIIRAIDNSEISKRIITNAQEFVSARHSAESYKELVLKEKLYLS